jgi:hypothetical protein
METKRCARCGEERELRLFSQIGRRMRGGERYRHPICNRCNADDARATRILLRAAGPRATNCEICRRSGETQLDHDHTMLRFRGWVCGSCNRGLAKFGDDLAGLRRAVAYLIAYHERTQTSEDEASPSKVPGCCRRCGVEREENDFRICGHTLYGELRAKTCRSCENKESKQLDLLRKEVGPPAPSCDICLRLGRTQLDHDHTTGDFRGWVCGSCNRGLGELGDNLASLRRTITYLERSITRGSGSGQEERARSRSPH